jgi:hypothetical protein
MFFVGNFGIILFLNQGVQPLKFVLIKIYFKYLNIFRDTLSENTFIFYFFLK